jgi:LPS-assembly protein
MHLRSRFIIFALPLFLIISGTSTTSRAQTIDPPTRNFLFLEDILEKKKTNKKKKEIQQKQSEVIKKARAAGFPYDVNATNLNYDSANKKLIGDGGVIISYASAIIEAERSEISTEEKTADLMGDVRVSDISGTIAADQMSLKLDDGTGLFKKTDMYFEDGHYRVVADEVKKVGKDDFEFKECSLTTCECADSDSTDPWRLEGKEGEMTREGYGTIHDGILYAYNIPIFYSPYLRFPVKTKRSSGILPGTFGGGSNSGLRLTLPTYLVIDESTDATVTAVYNSAARIGLDNDFRKIFSDHTSLQMGGLYFDESVRGNDFLGFNPAGLRSRKDPNRQASATDLNDLIPDKRWGGYLDFISTKHKFLGEDLQFVIKGRGVSDVALIREYNREDAIAPSFNTRFVTSRANMTYSFLDNYTLDTGVEYNQAMVDNQDTTLQRLPDVTIQGYHVLNPFGDNDLGAKLIINDQITETYFSRKDLFDGNKAEIYETANIPFHYKNYFDVNLGADVRATRYNLANNENLVNVPTVQPDGTTKNEAKRVLIEKESDRVLPGLSAQVSSVLEKVYDVEDSNPLKFLAELGSAGRQGELKRLKHTLEPDLRYRFIPEVDQDDNPQFDQFDVLRRKNFVTYSLMQRVYGRFEGRDQNIYGVEETTPEASDLGALTAKTPIDQAFDLGMNTSGDPFMNQVIGNRSELFNFGIAQTYDLNTAKLPSTPANDPSAFSDVSFRSNLIPNEYFRLNGGASISHDPLNFTAYDIGGQFLDKRGDQLRIRMNLVGEVRQLEESLELRLTDRVKFGFYSRYDDDLSKFLERKVGFRLNSSCRCWILDVDVWDRLQPDQTILQVTLTLNGLTQFGTNLWGGNNSNNGSTSNP